MFTVVKITIVKYSQTGQPFPKFKKKDFPFYRNNLHESIYGFMHQFTNSRINLLVIPATVKKGSQTSQTGMHMGMFLFGHPGFCQPATKAHVIMMTSTFSMSHHFHMWLWATTIYTKSTQMCQVACDVFSFKKKSLYLT